jgi:DNA-binding PadR family transcriptional regulator
MSNQDHLPLAPRDLLILAVLAEGPQHGYGIIKAVEARSESGVLLDPANLYRVLRRMRGLEWIRETDGSVAPSGKGAGEGAGLATRDGPTGDEGGGRNGFPSRRRTYEIAPEGKLLLSSELARLERLLRQVRPALASREGR